MFTSIQRFLGILGMSILFAIHNHHVNLIIGKEFVLVAEVLDIWIIHCTVRTWCGSLGVLRSLRALEKCDDAKIIGQGIDEGQVEAFGREAIAYDAETNRSCAGHCYCSSAEWWF